MIIAPLMFAAVGSTKWIAAARIIRIAIVGVRAGIKIKKYLED